MKKVQLAKLTLINFKAAKQREIVFSDNTVISGNNATGKTTLFDAFTWCLFGKDSHDRKDFEIKTRGSDNRHTKKAEASVTADLVVDGMEITLKRTFREKWVKPRGEEDEVFQGHETLYEINSVPMSAGDFKKNVENICDEGLFKLLTSHTAFAELGWQDKRAVLSNMAGDVTLESVSEGKADFEALIKQLAGRDFVQFRKEINARKKRIKDELEQIDPRIAEVHAGMPEVINEIDLRQDLKTIDDQIQAEQQALSDAGKAYENEAQQVKARLDEIAHLEAVVRKLKADDQAKEEQQVRERDKKYLEEKAAHEGIGIEIRSYADQIEALTKLNKDSEGTVETLRSEYVRINDLEFEPNPDDSICPTCKQTLQDAEEQKEKLRGNFNENKVKKLELIKQQAAEIKAKIEAREAEIKGLQASKLALEESRTDLPLPVKEMGKPFTVNPEIELYQNEIEATRATIKETQKPEIDRSKLTELGLQRDVVIKQLSTGEQRQKSLSRIAELEADKKAKGQELASVEKEEFTAERLAKAYSDEVQQRVNGLFEIVQFKMFKELINGGEEPDCQALINGVPYEAANNAARINAGIDIINALSKYHQKSVPVWVDNAEASNYIIPTDSQLIQLRVTTDNELKSN